MSITREEISGMIDSMLNTKKAIDADWAAGKRDGPRLQVFALADDVLRLLDAIQNNDAYAYKVAATEAREHAGNASFQAIAWVKQVREKDETP